MIAQYIKFRHRRPLCRPPELVKPGPWPEPRVSGKPALPILGFERRRWKPFLKQWLPGSRDVLSTSRVCGLVHGCSLPPHSGFSIVARSCCTSRGRRVVSLLWSSTISSSRFGSAGANPANQCLIPEHGASASSHVCRTTCRARDWPRGGEVAWLQPSFIRCISCSPSSPFTAESQEMLLDKLTCEPRSVVTSHRVVGTVQT